MKEAERKCISFPFSAGSKPPSQNGIDFLCRSLSVVSNYPWNNEVFCEEELHLTSYGCRVCFIQHSLHMSSLRLPLFVAIFMGHSDFQPLIIFLQNFIHSKIGPQTERCKMHRICCGYE